MLCTNGKTHSELASACDHGLSTSHLSIPVIGSLDGHSVSRALARLILWASERPRGAAAFHGHETFHAPCDGVRRLLRRRTSRTPRTGAHRTPGCGHPAPLRR